jgi:photosystem II stability/assembly factor-like uncharacterized protein
VVLDWIVTACQARRRAVVSSLLAINLTGVASRAALAQSSRPPSNADTSFLAPYWWRNIGPNRGGRSIAVAGSPSRPNEYYFGATGGGLWKTTDGGTSWASVTDGQLSSSSVGAVAVSPSNPDVIYLGMGETELRGNVMQGDGVYRSDDGGRTWAHRGLGDSQAIARIRIDPTDPNLVYVAALGHPFAPNEERGIFRSRDGGRTWSRVLFRSPKAGAVDLVIDPSNPRVLYATLWEVYRRPWQLWSGGEGSGLYKSTDGGDSWTELTRNPGLPGGVFGKMTVAVSPADPNRVWANIEATDGGLYRSDDAGATWTHVNDDRNLWQRAFYFLRIVADPRDRETLYILSFQLEKSTDGGKTFATVATPHADHHDLWIDPNDPRRMIEANDGGAIVSVNGGRTWTDQRYPTAQIYRVATTDEFPYHVCGAQQDNTTVCVPSAESHLAEPNARAGDWYYAVGGGESADIATKPGAPDIFFAGSTNTLTRYDRRTGVSRDVQPYPRIVMGEPASAMPERWNWTYPIAISRVNAKILLVGSQHLWKSVDDGRTWKKISPDLTRADPATMGNSGGPIVFDQDGPEIYATIFTIAPSRRDTATIWTGSDDGLVHVTRDGGRTWRNVTPPDLRPDTRVSRIDPSWHNAGAAYVAAERHQMDDRAPYIWKTRDYGATWTKTTGGLGEGDFVRVVREDRVRPGLLFAGTEHGVRVSFDDGGHWQSLSRNLPDVQVSDLVVEERDLVIATHGRSFWVLDDLSALRQVTPAMLANDARAVGLLRPATVVGRTASANIHYYLPRSSDSVAVEILDEHGGRVRTLGGAAKSAGMHRVRWDLRYPGATSFPGIVMEGGDPARGVWAPPGRYRARLTIRTGGSVVVDSQPLVLSRDPRVTDVSDADLRSQFELARRIRDKESDANGAVVNIRALRAELRQREAAVRQQPASDGVRLTSDIARLDSAISAIEATLYQVKNRSPKDKIAFPIRVNDRLTGLRAQVDDGYARPTDAQYAVFRELSQEVDRALAALSGVYRQQLARVNESLRQAGLPEVAVTFVR